MTVREEMERKQAAILASLREGQSRRTAVAAAGTHRTNFYRWLHNCPKFAEAVNAIEAEWGVSRLIRQVGPGSFYEAVRLSRDGWEPYDDPKGDPEVCAGCGVATPVGFYHVGRDCWHCRRCHAGERS